MYDRRAICKQPRRKPQRTDCETQKFLKQRLRATLAADLEVLEPHAECVLNIKQLVQMCRDTAHGTA
jgi:hypothetical protein